MAAYAAPVGAQEQDWTGFGNGNDTLEIVFINDGHVAPYHVAWLGGLEDAGAAYSEAFGNVETSWLSAEGSLEKMIDSINGLDISDDDRAAIFGGNTARLLGL